MVEDDGGKLEGRSNAGECEVDVPATKRGQAAGAGPLLWHGTIQRGEKEERESLIHIQGT